MKIVKYPFLVLLLSLVISCQEEKKPNRTITNGEPSVFNEDIRNYYFQVLDSAAFHIKKVDTTNTLAANKDAFLKSRMWYKRAEPLIMGYDYENYLSMNAPNLLKVEIDDYSDIKRLKPKSYQVLEEMLYGEELLVNRDFYNVYHYLQVRIPYIRRNHIIYRQQDRHHLKMMRDAIVNVATKGITGFDSPMLSNSLLEAVANYESLKEVMTFYREAFTDKALFEQWMGEIETTIATLTKGNFDTFDRYTFIKEHTNRQLALVNETALDWSIELNTSRPLNLKADNLFAADFFNMKMFSPQGSPTMSEERVALGKVLFNDENLSSSGIMSCATCHIKEKAFTDGHKTAMGNNGEGLLRNTPMLPYAVYQTTFFYDGRGDGLEGQIVAVANNENEFHLDLDSIEVRVKQDSLYKVPFDSLYDAQVTNRNIRNAIATYIRSLAPFDSKFDKNMQGVESSLSEEEVTGFNLFMGKAACATCHFPPAFNGTVPPKYMETEFENLGVPKTAIFDHPILDDDVGQYSPYEVEERRSFFKTSSVRNVALTGPYMHNGVYESLDDVMQFYNVGGGEGMGLDVPYQTLPPDSLGLTPKEIKAIIAFMHTLTDEAYTKAD
ncbi:cytochrome c peroxidase [uncultured Croceitalea sp.]|uniref:cytochrome-c peroxidase n=1 Tax=uncultured Croceitalea sp. TaxID=1798908 RepID=UPI003305F3B6